MSTKILALSGMALMATFSGQALAADGRGEWIRADRNHDGQVMFREAMSYAQDNFRGADRNGDGVLSGRELRRLHDDLVTIDYDRDGRVTSSDIDLNRDGRVSFFEYRAALRTSFANADRSRDGILSGYELYGRQPWAGYWRR